MNDDDLKKIPEPEKRNENNNGSFHITTSFTWILVLSIVILLVAGLLVYSAYMGALDDKIQNWQLAIWCVCILLSFYSVVKRSLAATILNFILFFVVSMIPVWELGRENLQSVFKLFFG